MENVMLDLETLDTKSGGVIVSIGAVFFDVEKGLGAEFHEVLSINRQLDVGATISPSTISWWNVQSPEAKVPVANAYLTTRRVEPVLQQFSDFVAGVNSENVEKVKMWGNGSDFDNCMLAKTYDMFKMVPPWKFYNNRCYRTLRSIVHGPKFERAGTHHNALDDAKSQALHAIKLLKFEFKLP